MIKKLCFADLHYNFVCYAAVKIKLHIVADVILVCELIQQKLFTQINNDRKL